MSVDNDQTKELFDVMHEIRDRTTRIETKTDRLEIIEEKADAAKTIANKAEQRSKTNADDIDKTNDQIKWLWTTAIAIVGLFLSSIGILITFI